jgi:hypothetical protein
MHRILSDSDMGVVLAYRRLIEELKTAQGQALKDAITCLNDVEVQLEGLGLMGYVTGEVVTA